MDEHLYTCTNVSIIHFKLKVGGAILITIIDRVCNVHGIKNKASKIRISYKIIKFSGHRNSKYSFSFRDNIWLSLRNKKMKITKEYSFEKEIDRIKY